MGITINCVTENKYVPETKGYIYHIKGHTRCKFYILRFKACPIRMTIENVHNSQFWIYYFPPNDGIHVTLGPRSLIVRL